MSRYARLAGCLFLLLTFSELRGEAAREETLTLHGSVGDSNGHPVPEAHVWLSTPVRNQSRSVALPHVTTDTSGQFQIKVPVHLRNGMYAVQDACALVASKPGVGYEAVRLHWFSLQPEAVAISLNPDATTTVKLLAAEGTPLDSGRVTVMGMKCNPLRSPKSDKRQSSQPPPLWAVDFPEGIRKQFSASVIPDGTAILRVPFDRILSLQVESLKTGSQSLINLPKTHSPLKLAPVGRIEGRLIAESATAAAGVSLSFWTSPAKRESPYSAYGQAEATTDQEGKFSILAISAGQIFVRGESTTYPAHRVRLANIPSVGPGETLELAIPWSRGVHVHGVVRDSKTHKPLAQAKVTIRSAGPAIEVTSDAEGRYEATVAPGQVSVQPTLPDMAPLTPEDLRSSILTIPHDADEFTLPTLDVRRWKQITGRVTYPDGEVAPGTTVTAVWHGISWEREAIESPSKADVQTDAKGRFRFTAVDPDARVTIFAKRAGEVVKEPLTIAPTSEDEVTLEISDANGVALTGRVVNEKREPVSDVALRVERSRLGSLTPGFETVFDDVVIRTGPDGHYQTPKTLAPFFAYRIVARPDSENQVTTAGQDISKSTEFPDLVVSSLLSLHGQVWEAGKLPIKAAAVLYTGRQQTVETTTDENGEFSLKGVEAGNSFLLIQMPGFPTFGERLQEGGNRTFSLTRWDVPQPGRTRSRVLPVSSEQRRAWAIQILEPVLKAKARNRALGLERFATIDVERTFEELESRPFKDSMMGDMVRSRIVRAWADTSTDDALAVADMIGFSIFRIQSMAFVADALGEEQRARKLDILAQALVVGRAEKNPVMRVHAFAVIGERLLDLGEREKAVKVLREGQKIAEQLATSAFAGYSRGAFAEELAQIDLDAALKLCEGLSDVDEYNRHMGNIAHELASFDPEGAERVLGLMKESSTRRILPDRDEKAVRVCYRMVRVDQPRARRVADSITTLSHQAYAKGLMAQSLLQFDPTKESEARQLLADAYEVLEHCPKSSESSYTFPPSTIAAALLSAVEKVDPERFDHYLWTTISLRRPVDPDATYHASAYDELAMLLSLYDIEAATAVLDWIPARFPHPQHYLPALALLRPQQAVASVAKTQEAQGLADFQQRITVASFLITTGSARRRDVLNKVLWCPDTEDFGL